MVLKGQDDRELGGLKRTFCNGLYDFLVRERERERERERMRERNTEGVYEKKIHGEKM